MSTVKAIQMQISKTHGNTDKDKDGGRNNIQREDREEAEDGNY